MGAQAPSRSGTHYFSRPWRIDAQTVQTSKHRWIVNFSGDDVVAGVYQTKKLSAEAEFGSTQGDIIVVRESTCCSTTSNFWWKQCKLLFSNDSSDLVLVGGEHRLISSRDVGDVATFRKAVASVGPAWAHACDGNFRGSQNTLALGETDIETSVDCGNSLYGSVLRRGLVRTNAPAPARHAQEDRTHTRPSREVASPSSPNSQPLSAAQQNKAEQGMSPNETRACADDRCRVWIHIDGETRSTASSAQSRGRRTQISAQTMQRPCTLRPYPVLTGSAAWDWPWRSILSQWRVVLSSPSRWRHQPLSEPEVSPERTQPQPRSEDRSRQSTINAKATPEDNRIRAGSA
ncbi:hypothetical protein HETIRDRAFT_431139 [Heterobasidion irregulare TC 32-1]|uniref:Uncharacterized protein n=1 Tax=Heterobasidion irregulare (strain TC 32-1) TaxID=747525 RepID=W4JNB6_HETIT|nr:uncharacterized protein HETIRDRAFT_431139 [Heterobasidion irregulare TC 32-1]ETW74969.1 hypothetical protein HETIRDRAFT_431139 [Heterobasidion irregulare TC 32-1]